MHFDFGTSRNIPIKDLLFSFTNQRKFVKLCVHHYRVRENQTLAILLMIGGNELIRSLIKIAQAFYSYIKLGERKQIIMTNIFLFSLLAASLYILTLDVSLIKMSTVSNKPLLRVVLPLS